MLLLLPLVGCGGQEHLNELYGWNSGFGASSVNGTSVLAKMLRDAGHRVRSARALYPRVGEADVIVWFPDDFDAPSADAQAWLDEWLLYNDEAKTLVYVSRDFEAGPLYWSRTEPSAPANQQPEFASRRRQSQTRFSNRRGRAPTQAECPDWFELDRRNSKVSVTKLQGPWAEGVDGAEAAIEHRRYLTPDPIADTLLADGAGHPLVSEIIYEPEEWDWRAEDSRLVMIENGSFLLNASLVDKEHRKLAGRLIESLGSPELDVVFLQSDAAPSVLDSDPDGGPPIGFELFRVWPIGLVLAQLAALGLVFALSRWPIFGVPRRLEEPSLTDFGRHVTALGRLLAATRDRAYAYAQLRAFFQTDDKDG